MKKNWLKNPSAETDVSFWGAQGTGTVRTRETGQPQAATCFKLVTPGTVASEGLAYLPSSEIGVSNGQNWILRVDLWGAGRVRLHLRLGNIAGSLITERVTPEITLTATRTTYTLPILITESTAKWIAPKVLTAVAPAQAVTFYATNFSLTRPDYVSPSQKRTAKSRKAKLLAALIGSGGL